MLVISDCLECYPLADERPHLRKPISQKSFVRCSSSSENMNRASEGSMQSSLPTSATRPVSIQVPSLTRSRQIFADSLETFRVRLPNLESDWLRPRYTHATGAPLRALQKRRSIRLTAVDA